MKNKLISLSFIATVTAIGLHIFAPGLNADPYLISIGAAAAIVALLIRRKA